MAKFESSLRPLLLALYDIKKIMFLSYSRLLFRVLVVLRFLITKLTLYERKKVLEAILDRVD
jgi:hypothetical protein